MITRLKWFLLPRHVYKIGNGTFLLLAFLGLNGCYQAGPTHSIPDTFVIDGRVSGAGRPIAGSLIQLYAAETSGSGSLAQPLLHESVRSDSNGRFFIREDLECPSSSANVFVGAQGGRSNPTAESNNAIALIALLGPCGHLSNSTFISVNEATTVASLASMFPYMNSMLQVGSSERDPVASLARMRVRQLVDTPLELSLEANRSGVDTVSIRKRNSLANIMAACIDFPVSVCGEFFSLATFPDEPAPTNTLSAMIAIAKHPDANVTVLFSLAHSVRSHFQPTLDAPPSDWALEPLGPQSAADREQEESDEAESTAEPGDVNTAAVTTAFATSTVLPTSASVELLGTIPVTQPLHGLGFNLNPTNDWELQMAAAAGATHARIQCGWNGTETQTPPPHNNNLGTQFVLPAGCVAGLKSAAAYGIHPTLVAAFGPPYHAILKVTIPTGAAVGARSLKLQFASGVGGDTLGSIRPFWDNIISASDAYITNRHSYAGGLITGITLTNATHATVTLASGLTSALPANTTTQYTINEGLYLPAATSGPKDASVLAYAKYAQYLASQIAASKNTGEVELWNEPPWANDPWDNRSMFYDTFTGPISPGPQQASLPNFGFVAALQSQKPPAGVTFIWGGTNKSGANSLLMSRMFANTGVYAIQPATVITQESFHPYGNSPEDTLWTSKCLSATVLPYPTIPTSFSSCNLAGTPGGNLSQAVQQTLVEQSINAAYGIGHSLTETGTALGTDAQKARFVIRQYLGFQAVGITPLDFFKFYDATSGYTFVNPVVNADGTHSPLPALTALSGLMADLALIGRAPVVPISTTVLPTVRSYSGTYPLSTVQIVGARAGDPSNSILMAVWQRSNIRGTTWSTLPQPAAAPVNLELPSGMAIVAVRNLDTRSDIPYTLAGQVLAFSVSDDPIEIFLEPSTKKILTVTVKSATALSGTATATLSASVAYTGVIPPTGAVAFTLDATNSTKGICTGSVSPLTCTSVFNISALSASSHTISVTVGGDTLYNQASGTGTLTVTSSHLQFVTQPSSTTLGAVFSTAVEVLDASGNPLSISDSVSLSLAANPGNASLLGTTTVQAVNGVATFRDLSLNAGASGYTLVASSPDVEDATSAPFDVTVPNLFVSLANVPVGTTATGRVYIPAPVVTNVPVTLISTHPDYVSVSSKITIPAGETSAPFDYTGVTVGIATVTASSTNYSPWSRGLAAIPAAPTVLPTAGAYSVGQVITLMDTTTGVTIYYTLDGSAPTTASNVYSAPLALTGTETIKAVAVESGQSSATSTNYYTLSP